MKVALLNSLYPPRAFGGAERSVRMLAEGLARSSHDVVMITARPGWSVHRREQEGVRIYEVGLRNVYWAFAKEASPVALKPVWHLIDEHNPLMVRTVRRVLADERPDLLHTHNVAGFSVGVWQAAEALGIPVVHTLRDYYLLCVRAALFRGGKACAERRCLECRVFSSPKRRPTRWVDRLIGVSQHIIDEHRRYGIFCDTPSQVIHNEAPAPVEEADRTASDRPVRIGYLGRLHPTKGLEVLLAAVGQLSAGSYELWIGGEGPQEYVDELERRFGGPDIRFLGRVGSEEFLQGIDVLVVPSLWMEPFGRVIHEAYAYGVPVLGSTRGGIPEAIDEGRTGFVFDPTDPPGLARLLGRIRPGSDTWNELRTACVRRARRWQQEDVVRIHLEAYMRTFQR